MDITQDNYTCAMRVVNLFKIATIFRVRGQKKLKKIIAHNVPQISEGKALKNKNLILKLNIIMKTKMSNYRNRFAFAYVLLAVVFLVGCTEKESNLINEQSNNRIKLIEDRIINGYRYTILEVDSVQYLTQDKGGFVRLGK